MLTAMLIFFAAASVAEEPVDSDRDGMPDAWEKRYGFNPKNATDATADDDQDGFTNLEEYRNGTAPVGPCVDYALYVDKVVAKGTNRWIRFYQFAGKDVWVREGKPAGPVGGIPDWNKRRFWERVLFVAVDDSVQTNIQVVITFQDSGKTNTWSVPFIGSASRKILKEEDIRADKTPKGIDR